MTPVATIGGPWEVTFPPNLGAPPKVSLTELQPLTANSDEGVKYFSGTATYTTTVQLADSQLHPGARIFLDLGTVRDVAEVTINGQAIGTLWKPPYQLDVTRALKAGPNQLEIKVTNEWTNRIAGDRVLPPEKRVLSPVPPRPGTGGASQPLPESGLLGPVRILSSSEP